MTKKILLLLLLMTILAACNAGATPAPTTDVNAINTAAFETAMAQISGQQTQTALAAPSITPLPTNTAASLATVALPTANPAGAASPTGNAGALPTVSFNVTPNTNTTPLAGFTQLAGSPVAPANTSAPLGDACNNNVFVADVTIPDGTVLKPGINFEKVWRVQNTGNCKWDDGYKLVYIGGDNKLDPFTKELSSGDFVDPGATGDIGIELTTPLTEGTYTETWRLQADNGAFFGTLLTVVVEVKK